MRGDLKTSLIRIFVPTTGHLGSVGTGYPVAHDRIITARHVVRPDNRHRNKPIVLTWNALDEKASCDDDAIVWESTVFDVALLSCALPKQALPVRPSMAMPRHNQSWGSEGFARAGRRSGSRDPVPLKGTTYSQEPCDRRFQLGIDNQTDLPRGWKGASGSPVFVDEQLIGVITECPENFKQGRFKASATFRLFENAAFRQALGDSEREAYIIDVQDNVERELERAPAAREALLDAGVILSTADTSPRALASALVNTLDAGKALQALKTAHDALHAKKAVVEVETVRSIARRLCPAIVDPQTVEMVRALKSDSDHAIIALPAVTLTVAEIIMAGADRRSAQFGVRKKKKNWPAGSDSFLISGLLEVGPEASAEEYERAVRKYLEVEFGDDHTLKMFEHDPESRAEHVRDVLKELPESRYLVCTLAAKDGESAYKRLKKAYQHIVFIQLTPDSTIRSREHQLLFNVLDLLAPVAG